MSSICKIVVDSLISLRSKLASALAMDDELSPGQNRDTCEELEKQIEEILFNFTFLLPLLDSLNKWVDAKRWDFQSLLVKIQASIEEAVEKVKPDDADNVWYDICEMLKKKVQETTQDTTFLWACRQNSNIRRRVSKMVDVLTELNAKIDILKPKIERVCLLILRGSKVESQIILRDSFECKEFGFLVSSTCSCLLEIKQNYTRDADGMKVLEFEKNLLDFQILLHGLPDIPGVEDISINIARVAICALLVSCRWWARKLHGFTFTFEYEHQCLRTLWDSQMKISADDPKTLDQILRLLKTLKTTVPSLFAEKVIEFAKYVLPYWFGHVEFTKEMESLKISLATDLTTELDREDWQIKELLYFKELVFKVEKLFSCWMEEDGSLLLRLLPNVWLMKGEDIIMKHLRYEDGLQLFEKCELQHIRGSSLQERTENVNQTTKFVEEVAELLTNLPSLSFPESRTVGMCLILLRIQCFKLECTLEDYNGCFKLSIKDKVQSFREGLKYLIYCFISEKRNLQKLYQKSVSFFKAQIEAGNRTVESFCHTLLTYNITEEIIESMDILLSDMLDEIIEPVIAQCRQICIPVIRTSCPKTDALGFYDALLSKLKVLINYQVGFFLSSKRQIEDILADLQFFRQFLGDIPASEVDSQELRNLCGHVIDVAFETEYLFDSIVEAEYLEDGNSSEWCNSIWLYDLLKRIRQTNLLVMKGQEKRTKNMTQQNVPQTSRHVVLRVSSARIDDIVLSLDDQKDLIIDLLVGGYPQRQVASIVGMPGIGKTTLAKKVYSSPVVSHHFHVRAWCCVGEVYRKRELLLEILNNIVVLTDNNRGMSTEDLELKLRQFLLKKKYLIIIDDMWHTEAWDDLQTSLPENENGSRILITSRLNHVALKAKAHYLRLLSDAESWALLQMKIFEEECCPNELIVVGREIAKNCKGLPLAVVAMAGILKRTDRQENMWKEITKNLNSKIVDDPQEQCRDILEMSYKFLPDYLKACFLYFGAFLEDQEIPVTKLIRLWIAEGFVQQTTLKSMEDLAEGYLEDLIGRSLVIFAQPRSRGGSKTCRVHDLLRNFCQSKANEDSFLRVITMPNEPYASFDDLDFLVNVNFRNPPTCKTYDDHRLCFYSKRNHFIQSRPSGSLARSLLFFATNDKYARSSYDISFISRNFRRLKVLDLECINMGPSFPTGIEQMIWLKYLAVSGDVEYVPSTIAKISNLETFVLRGLKGKVILPDTIWSLKWLRHVHVTDVAFMDLNGTSPFSGRNENSSVLDYLVTLSSVFLPYGDDTNNMLRMFPNLRKLGCIFSESPYHYGSCNLFPRLDILTQLESLKISYYGRALCAAEFSFPLSLRKLTLSNFRLPWSHISVIGRLQNLEVLKLLSRAYDGEIWDMVEGEFYNLKFLKLENLNFSKWNTSSDSLPNLEKLVLKNCKHLEEVPSSLVEFSTLKMIEVKWCGESAEASIRRMRDEADEFLSIIITSDFDSRLSL